MLSRHLAYEIYIFLYTFIFFFSSKFTLSITINCMSSNYNAQNLIICTAQGLWGGCGTYGVHPGQLKSVVHTHAKFWERWAMAGRPGAFHKKHGTNIRLYEDGTVAHRVDSYNKAVVFTEQPIPIGASFQVKMLDKGGGWAGSIVSFMRVSCASIYEAGMLCLLEFVGSVRVCVLMIIW